MYNSKKEDQFNIERRKNIDNLSLFNIVVFKLFLDSVSLLIFAKAGAACVEISLVNRAEIILHVSAMLLSNSVNHQMYYVG